MVMLLALLASAAWARAGAGDETDAVETGATGAGLLGRHYDWSFRGGWRGRGDSD